MLAAVAVAQRAGTRAGERRRRPLVRDQGRRDARLLGLEQRRPGDAPERDVQRGRRGRAAHLRDPDRRHRRLLGQERRRRVDAAVRDVQLGERRRRSQLRGADRRHARVLGAQHAVASVQRRAGRDLPSRSAPATRPARPGAAPCPPSGLITCWGYNSYGRGNPPPGTFTDAGAGGTHGCALTTDAGLACWGGFSSNGAPLPTPPAGIFTAVSAGYDHSCGIRADATLACVGDDAGRASHAAGRDLPLPQRGVLPLLRGPLQRRGRVLGLECLGPGEPDPDRAHPARGGCGAEGARVPDPAAEHGQRAAGGHGHQHRRGRPRDHGRELQRAGRERLLRRRVDLSRTAAGRADVQPVGALRAALEGGGEGEARARHERLAGDVRGRPEWERGAAAARAARTGRRQPARTAPTGRTEPTGRTGRTARMGRRHNGAPGATGQPGPTGPRGPKGNTGAGLTGATIAASGEGPAQAGARAVHAQARRHVTRPRRADHRHAQGPRGRARHRARAPRSSAHRAPGRRSAATPYAW